MSVTASMTGKVMVGFRGTTTEDVARSSLLFVRFELDKSETASYRRVVRNCRS